MYGIPNLLFTMKLLFDNFRGNALGGLTAGNVALPLALAFGVSSGLGPSAGLYGTIFLSFFAALFGGTPTQISGPTAPMTAVSMVVIAGIIGTHEGDLARALPYILMVFLLSGLLQIGLGVAGLGKYIKYIPYPVVSGLYALEDVIINLERQGIEVLLVGVQEQPKYLMKVIGMIGELIEEEHLFENFSTARLWINQQNGGK